MSTFAAVMRVKRRFIWFFAALCVVFLTVAINCQEQDAMPAPIPSERTESAVVTPQRQHHHEATLTDASRLYRICSSRPQRIQPTQGSRFGRTLTPSFSMARLRFVKPLHSYFDSRCRMESAPFCLSASCDYYVIALRHIIR